MCINYCRNVLQPERGGANHSVFFAPLLLSSGYAVAQLVESLRYKPEGAGSVLGGIIGIWGVKMAGT